MKIVLSKWKIDPATRKETGERIELVALGATAKECMRAVDYMREHNDLTRYTPWSIDRVED